MLRCEPRSMLLSLVLRWDSPLVPVSPSSILAVAVSTSIKNSQEVPGAGMLDWVLIIR